MSYFTLIRSCIVAIVFVFPSLQAVTPTLKPWTPEAMMETKSISDPQISPDNKKILFVVTEPCIKGSKTVLFSRIYKADTNSEDSYLPFTGLEHSSTQPRWSPDGQWIAFLANRKGINQIYLIHADGGEAVALTDGKNGVQTFSWSPEGERIAFVMADEIGDKKSRKKSSLAYIYKLPIEVNRLWVLNVFSRDHSPMALTGDEYHVRGAGDFGTINCEFDWSPDGSSIVFAHSPTGGWEGYHLDSSIAVIEVDSGKTSPWKKEALYEAMPRFSPDGALVAYLSDNSSKRYAFNRRIAICSPKGELLRFLSPTDNGGPLIAGANLLGWSQDGQQLLFFEPNGTKYQIQLVSADGVSVDKMQTGEQFFTAPVLSPDRKMWAFVGQNLVIPPEIYVSSLENFSPQKTSSLNDFTKDYYNIQTKNISWKSKDGIEIEGQLILPVGYEKGKSYPLLLMIHGGPMGFFNESFLGTNPTPYPELVFAQEGYAILRPNPRGSTGYGEDFLIANYDDWGGRDYEDLIAGVDFLIDRGIADSERLGVMGWSYGGYMTAWAITQSSRFKAASMGAGIVNLVSMAGTSDLHRFMDDYLGDFFTKQEFYRERSPLTHAHEIKTPLLIQHGDQDKRVPITQAYELYHAMERQGQKPVLIVYPGMDHRISDPNMFLDAMKSNLDWFHQHL